METLLLISDEWILKGSYRTYEEWKPGNGMPNSFETFLASSYRTYEEWKRISLPPSPSWYSFVLTVPMRNGNFIVRRYRQRRKIVLTVPMRNGNSLSPGEGSSLSRVLTVPMRNGNIDIQMHSERTNYGSYRTYEEWKLDTVDTNCHCSYPVLTVPMRNGNLRKLL